MFEMNYSKIVKLINWTVAKMLRNNKLKSKFANVYNYFSDINKKQNFKFWKIKKKSCVSNLGSQR